MAHLKYTLFTIVLLLNCGAYAQNTQAFKNILALPDNTLSSRVVVVERGDAAQVVRSLEGEKSVDKLSGYRVRIFFDNSQDARSAAAGTYGRFSELFPGIPAYMSYENPYFKVTVGNCLTNEEAIILWGKIKHTFDKAFVIRENIPIDAITEWSE